MSEREKEVGVKIAEKTGGLENPELVIAYANALAAGQELGYRKGYEDAMRQQEAPGALPEAEKAG